MHLPHSLHFDEIMPDKANLSGLVGCTPLKHHQTPSKHPFIRKWSAPGWLTQGQLANIAWVWLSFSLNIAGRIKGPLKFVVKPVNIASNPTLFIYVDEWCEWRDLAKNSISDHIKSAKLWYKYFFWNVEYCSISEPWEKHWIKWTASWLRWTQEMYSA